MVSPRRPDHARGPLFQLGQMVATPGAIEVMERLGINPADLIARHVTGDWGDIHPEDRGLNEQALRDGSRIFSVYGARGSDECLWVIWVMGTYSRLMSAELKGSWLRVHSPSLAAVIVHRMMGMIA